MRDLFLLIIILFTVKIGFSQTEKVLFTVNKTDVSLNEFLRVYNKNSALIKTDNKQKIEEYLKLFIDYKIKVAEAYALGLNNNKLYIKDVADYKKQLSKKYLAIRVVNDQLINEAYDRSLNEVKVNHILVKIKENASSKDSLRAYKLIVSYRKRALKYGFENTMNTVNDGTIVFGESLGYISSFKTVYPFENVAFNTSVNEISKPFRTSFGFHILNVLDKRKSQGNVKVSHILISKNNNKLTNSAKSRSNEIWKEVRSRMEKQKKVF